MVMPSGCCSARISRRISSRSCASRLEAARPSGRPWSRRRSRGRARRAAAGRRRAARACARAASPGRGCAAARRAARACSAAGTLAHLEAEHDVLGDGEMREQRVGLEHHRDAALRRAAAPVTSRPSMTMRPALGGLEPGDQPQRRRLAAARRAEQRRRACRLGREAGAVDRLGRAPVLAHALEAKLHPASFDAAPRPVQPGEPPSSCRKARTTPRDRARRVRDDPTSGLAS